MVAIIDYGAGNIKSVQNAIEYLGAKTVLTNDEKTIHSSQRVILPGVGAFGDAMTNLDKYGLTQIITDVINTGKPFLGICLGLQVLLEESEESPGIKGLGIFKGLVKKIQLKPGYKIPHMGWSMLQNTKRSRLLNGISKDTSFYFVHSYYASSKDDSCVAAQCEYTDTMDVALEFNNTFALQFHPEKSGAAGMTILKNFLSIK